MNSLRIDEIIVEMFSVKFIFLCIFGVYFVVSAANALNASGTFIIEPSNRIVNGRDASRGQFPYQVSLRLANGQHFCSGSILNRRWVITTGVCVSRLSPSLIIIFAGAHYRSKFDGMPYIVDRIDVHNQFRPDRLLNDLALIRTAYPFTWMTPLIRSIALPRTDTTAANVNVIVSGWGFVKVFAFI